MKTLNLEIKSDIHTRDEIRNLFNFNIDEDFENIDSIVIDMQKCNFISRSPAHELVKQVQKLKTNYKIKVQFKSINQEVEKMINIVSLSLKNTDKSKQNYSFLRFNDKKELFYELEKL